MKRQLERSIEMTLMGLIECIFYALGLEQATTCEALAEHDALGQIKMESLVS